MPEPSVTPPRAHDRPAAYRERLSVPIAWWVLSALFAGSLWLAVGWYLGWGAGFAAGLVAFAVTGLLFVGYGRVPVLVRDGWLQAGRARIEARYLADVRALTPEETRRRRGPQADVRAYLLLRPYVSTAVEVTLDDPADPAPYWLISTRHPRRLATALRQLLSASGPVGSAG